VTRVETDNAASKPSLPDVDVPPAEPGETVAGWGRVPVPGREVLSEDLEAASERAVLFRGLGRSYGDSALPPPSAPEVLTTTRADRLLAFDPATGVLRAEAGLSLREMNRIFLPRGYFTPVTPGTQFVTLGGMVAADVHGKGHHVAGCFGEHVTRLKMRVADGRVLWCSDEAHPELFRATIGGMGLTGHILEVELRMRRIRSPWVFEESQRVDDIDQYIDALKDAAGRYPYSVGWIDCLTPGKHMGRGILMAGDWADPKDAPKRQPLPKPRLTFPLELPSWVLNRQTIGAFNFAYYWKHLPRKFEHVTHWEPFFYPLDFVRQWNRLYGRPGFTQYQCVLPEAAGRGASRRVLEILTQRGGASFLCVIKDCGPEGKGTLSFPMRGTSIALDIPMRDDTQALIDALNEQVLEEGGRIYLAKDTLTRPEHFRAMEPRLDAFQAVRDRWDPERRFRSAQSVRLFGDPA
jgi:decaprenylphospho-beta-D-ribofuranose 2-oxidase